MYSMMAWMGAWGVVFLAFVLFVVGLVIYWAVRFAMRHERGPH